LWHTNATVSRKQVAKIEEVTGFTNL
jgi:hypothetical protein